MVLVEDVSQVLHLGFVPLEVLLVLTVLGVGDIIDEREEASHELLEEQTFLRALKRDDSCVLFDGCQVEVVHSAHIILVLGSCP